MSPVLTLLPFAPPCPARPAWPGLHTQDDPPQGPSVAHGADQGHGPCRLRLRGCHQGCRGNDYDGMPCPDSHPPPSSSLRHPSYTPSLHHLVPGVRERAPEERRLQGNVCMCVLCLLIAITACDRTRFRTNVSCHVVSCRIVPCRALRSVAPLIPPHTPYPPTSPPQAWLAFAPDEMLALAFMVDLDNDGVVSWTDFYTFAVLAEQVASDGHMISPLIPTPTQPPLFPAAAH